MELDHVGLCWDADLISSGSGWQARSFRGTDWQIVRSPEKIAYRLNTYRVLLTRARYETLIWVLAGDVTDRTRDPGLYDQIADMLARCGVRQLETPDLPLAALHPSVAAGDWLDIPLSETSPKS